MSLNPNATGFVFSPKATSFTPKVVEKKDEETEEKPIEEEEEEEEIGTTGKKLREDPRDHLNIVFVGHVDAGKSTLGGQILYLLGQVDKRTIEKYQREAKDKNRESWFLAYILDLGEEEREKGKTVDVSRAGFETENKRYTILDAPGHRKYVPNMISGASQADVAVLVVSARKGEFESGFEKDGQTVEHAQLAKTLGIKKIVVAINKMDDKSVEWSQERYDDIVTKLTKFFTSIGYSPKKNVIFLPLSGLSGANVVKPLDPKVFPCYKGGSLIETLDSLDIKHPHINGPVRIPVIDKYKDGSNFVILGKIESGTIKRKDQVIIMPGKLMARIKKIHLHHMEVDIAKPGENVKVILQGLESAKESDVQIGNVICDVDHPLAPIQEFVGQFLVLDNKPIFTIGYSANVHSHCVGVGCTLTGLISKLDPKTGKPEPKKPTHCVAKGMYTGVFKTDYPICVEKYDVIRQLGRFTIREEKTVAIGTILKIKPMK